MAHRDKKVDAGPAAGPPRWEDSHRLMRLAGMAGWTWDCDNGMVMSPEMEAMFGLEPGTGAAPDLQALVHPDDRPRVSRLIVEAASKGGEGTFEHRARGADGNWLHLRVVYSAEQTSVGAFRLRGMVQDITELAEARDAALRVEQQVRGLMEETRVSARRLKLALGAAQAGVFEIDHEAETFWCSPEFVLLLGRQLTYEEARAAPWPFVHPQDREVIAEAAAVWSTGTLLNEPVDMRIIRPDGAVRWMRLYFELRRDMRGRARRSVGLVLDVDERKRQELALIEAERAAQVGAEAKARFLASVSHEIRTPLNGVLGVLHLLKSEELSGGGRQLLDEALACGGMLSELINDVLDFSKIEAGRLELSPEPTDPAAILAGVAGLLRPMAEAKGLTLTVQAEAEVGWVMVDPIRLRQALFNLMGNAVKFTTRGGVTARMTAPRDGRLRFEIEDTGIGIAPSARAGVFERFHQADGSTTRRFGGTGLGLAITKSLAELMDGAVEFDSAEGRGSTFRLEIGAPMAAETRPAAEEDPVTLQGLRVLVVEDNATNRLIVRKLLETLGACVEEAEDGGRGVERAAEDRFDIVLMDVQMPGMDGLEATRLIRAAEGAARRTPIVALTANVLSHQKQAYLDCGMDGVVAKPISPAALVGEIIRMTTPAAKSQAA